MRSTQDVEEVFDAEEDAYYDELSMCEIYKEINLSGNLISESNGSTRTSERYGGALKHAEEWVLEVLSSTQMPYIFETDDFGNLKPRLTQFGKSFITRIDALIDHYKPGMDYSENVNLFYSVCDGLGLHDRFFSFKGISPFAGVEREQLLNKLIEEIRKIAGSKEFKESLRRRKQNSKRNYQKLERYVNELFARFSRLLVIRLDFYYPNNGIEDVNGVEAAKLRERFLNNRRGNTLFNAMVGYVWKLELGESRGLHLHFAFFYDGSKVRKDAYLAQRIGEYWVDKITTGKGSFHSCNRNKGRYAALGIGMVNHDDDTKRADLLKALSYLTKKEQYLRLKTNARVKVFGKALPGPGKATRGRPRRGNSIPSDDDV